MAATIYLIRHAVTPATGTKLGGRTTASLSDKGVGQAEATRDHLDGVTFAAIYASPLPRTTETAEIIAKPRRMKVRPADGMIEVDYGSWTDKALKPLYKHKLWPVIQQTPSLVTFPGGESIRGMQERAIAQVEAIAAAHDKKTVAVFSHADVIKAVLAFYLGMHLDSFQRLHVSPASVSILSTGKGVRPTVSMMNNVPYATTHP